MIKTQNIKIVDVGGDKIVIGTLSEIYKKLKTRKEKDKFEKDLGKKIISKIKDDLSSIVRKSLKLKSVNAIKLDEYYMVFIEAIDSYAFGNHISCIACCGIVAEQITYRLLKDTKTNILSEKDFETMSRIPAKSTTERTAPPAITPRPSLAGFNRTLALPSFMLMS